MCAVAPPARAGAGEETTLPVLRPDWVADALRTIAQNMRAEGLGGSRPDVLDECAASVDDLAATVATLEARLRDVERRTEVHEFYEFVAKTEEQFDAWLHERIVEVRGQLGLPVPDRETPTVADAESWCGHERADGVPCKLAAGHSGQHGNPLIDGGWVRWPDGAQESR